MRFELARPFSAALRIAIKFSRTRSGKMPLPDTRMSAPASATTGAVSTLIPPSTWISTARFSLSTSFRAARKYVDKENLAVEIQVDGGIKVDTAPVVAEAGADILVSGSGIFPDRVRENLIALRRAAEKGRASSKRI